MGLLSANLKTALQGGGPAIGLLELALPGQTLRYGVTPYASAGNGLYDGRVTNLPATDRTCDSTTGNLEGTEFQVEIEDLDQTFAQILEGSSAGSVWNSVARLYVASPLVAPADWLSEFVGVLAAVSKPGIGRWSLSLRSNAAPLGLTIPRTIINAQDWPNADASVVNLRAPLLYGNHDAAGTATSGGAVPCLYVDNSGFRYMVCQGRALQVAAVFKDGTLVSTSAYTVTYVTVRGRLYTLIDFASDQGTSKITCNAQGYDTVGDGSGTLITNPADVLKHLLHNWVYGDHPGTGAWYTSAAPVDSTSFSTAQTFFSTRSYLSARYYGGNGTTPTAADLLGEWAHTFEVRTFWTGAGNIALVVRDPSSFAYSDDPWIRHDVDQVGSDFTIDYRDDMVIDRIVAGTTRMESAGNMSQTVEVRDPHSTRNLPETFDAVFTPSVVS